MGDFSIRLAGLESIFTQENESRAWSQLSAGQVFGKIRVLTKSRNRCRLSLFRFHYSTWLKIIFTFPSMLHRLYSPKASITALNSSGNFCIAYQRPLVIEDALNFDWLKRFRAWLYAGITCANALLFQCIFACEYKRLSSLLTMHSLIVSKQLPIKSLNKIWVWIVYRVVQSSFHTYWFLLLTQKGIHLHMKAVSTARPSQLLLLVEIWITYNHHSL